MHKTCKKCGEVKLVTEFYTRGVLKSGRTAYQPNCKGCHSQYYKKQWKEKGEEERNRHREQMRRNHIKRKFGLTEEQFCAMLVEQNYTCKICGVGIHNSKDACIDHNHTTGAVRALLCNNCNLALGLMKEDPKALSNMITYINDYLQDNPLEELTLNG